MRPSEYEDNADLTLPSEYKDSDDENESSSYYKMKKLQLLDIEDRLLERIMTKVRAPNLIWLRWEKCPCSSLPSWTLTRNLRVLDVQGNELETLWQSEKQVLLNQNFVFCTTRCQIISKGFVDDNHRNLFLTVESHEHFAGTFAVAGVKD